MILNVFFLFVCSFLEIMRSVAVGKSCWFCFVFLGYTKTSHSIVMCVMFVLTNGFKENTSADLTLVMMNAASVLRWAVNLQVHIPASVWVFLVFCQVVNLVFHTFCIIWNYFSTRYLCITTALLFLSHKHNKHVYTHNYMCMLSHSHCTGSWYCELLIILMQIIILSLFLFFYRMHLVDVKFYLAHTKSIANVQ